MESDCYQQKVNTLQFAEAGAYILVKIRLYKHGNMLFVYIKRIVNQGALQSLSSAINMAQIGIDGRGLY